MKADVAARGVSSDRMTAMPMGVDLEIALPKEIHPASDQRLVGKRVIVYLGTLERQRRIEVILEMFALVLARSPAAVLVIVGDTEHRDYRASLARTAEALGIADSIIWTGWLPANQAWRYVRSAEVGLSPVPRGVVYDCSTPTKIVEYLALGVPVVANDSPDQERIIRESGAGLCVKLNPTEFADAVLELLADKTRLGTMSEQGIAYVANTRSYSALAKVAADSYHNLLSGGRS